MALTLIVNGQTREFAELSPDFPLTDLLHLLSLKSDRVAVELNGSIVRRELWQTLAVREGDRLEIVHFVGGGSERLAATTWRTN